MLLFLSNIVVPFLALLLVFIVWLRPFGFHRLPRGRRCRMSPRSLIIYWICVLRWCRLAALGRQRWPSGPLRWIVGRSFDWLSDVWMVAFG